MKLLWIACFGLLGVFARYGVGVAVGRALPSPFPLATFLINVVGSFLIGVAFAAGSERHWLSPELATGLMVGFLGGFTTFSSYALETARLLEGRASLVALAYVAGSPVAGVLATFAGLWAVRHLPVGGR